MSLSDKKICNLYVLDKMSCLEISRIDGRSESTIYGILKHRKIKFRSRSEANQIFSTQLIVKLYNVGLSCSQIGRLLGIDSSTIIKRLQLLNFPLRTKSVAANIRYSETEFKKFFFNSETMNLLKAQ